MLEQACNSGNKEIMSGRSRGCGAEEAKAAEMVAVLDVKELSSRKCIPDIF